MVMDDDFGQMMVKVTRLVIKAADYGFGEGLDQGRRVTLKQLRQQWSDSLNTMLLIEPRNKK